MDDELLIWMKSNDSRLLEVEKSVKGLGERVGEVVGKLNVPTNGKVNPTVSLIVRYIAFPLIVILGSLYGVHNVFGG